MRLYFDQVTKPELSMFGLYFTPQRVSLCCHKLKLVLCWRDRTGDTNHMPYVA